MLPKIWRLRACFSCSVCGTVFMYLLRKQIRSLLSWFFFFSDVCCKIFFLRFGAAHWAAKWLFLLGLFFFLVWIPSLGGLWLSLSVAKCYLCRWSQSQAADKDDAFEMEMSRSWLSCHRCELPLDPENELNSQDGSCQLHRFVEWFTVWFILLNYLHFTVFSLGLSVKHLNCPQPLCCDLLRLVYTVTKKMCCFCFFLLF